MKLLEKHFEIALETPDGITRLRELILKLAMQGKLVHQDLNEISIKDYLEDRIITKSDKKSINIDEIRKPFNIPRNWDWFRLGDIGETNIGLTYSPKDISDRGTIVLRSSNIQKGKIDLKDLVRVNKGIKENLIIKNNDILICARNGSKALVGKAAIIKDSAEVMTFGAFMAIYRSEFYNYVYQFLQSPAFRESLENVSTTTINQITQHDLKNTIIPLPPLEEQKRIVEKIDQLMLLCDKLEAERNRKDQLQLQINLVAINNLIKASNENSFTGVWNFITREFDTLYTVKKNVTDLKNLVLELAIRGKLVKQNKDQSAKVEYKFIEYEKSTIKESKSGSKLKECNISENDVPFELPENWIWVRLGNICSKIGSGSTPRGGKNVYQREGVKFIRSQNVYNSGLIFENVAFIDNDTHAKMINTKVVSNDILLNITGGSIGRASLVPDDFDEANVSQHVTIIRLLNGIDNRFIHQFILSPYFQEKIMQVQTGANREGLAKKNMELMLVPLPPYEEQKKISKRVKDLFDMCNRLDELIEQSSNKQSQILNAVLAQV